MEHIDADLFRKRFTTLVLGSSNFPKKRTDQQILLLSASLLLKPAQEYSEGVLNNLLEAWCAKFGRRLGLDHVTLRRYLVDESFLLRSSSGEVYQIHTDSFPCSYDPAIEQIDPDSLIEHARQEREARKRKYMAQG